jgi:hypothetical protein
MNMKPVERSRHALSEAIAQSLSPCEGALGSNLADYLTTSGEYDNKQRRENGVFL